MAADSTQTDSTFQAGKVDATLTEVRLPNGLVLDRLELRGQGLRVAPSPFSLSLSSPGSLKAVLSAASLAAFLEASSPSNLGQFAVKADDGLVVIDVSVQMVFVARVRIILRLVIQDEARLVAVLQSVSLPMAMGVVASQLASLNPILDSAQLPVPAQMKSVESKAGAITLTATISPS
ncbi:MAG: LmeA family phospholipid-binding protein [Fimbriimonas ginsengisoli]|uniref:LmeA family phospholipid-binding protein n=1 Tax=Fimbriimonas ginsengisoli TaxID=1005039 RepID=A0A931PT86_FIMGI|nr:LmeA family phospholipid-binding protein [Fimbriimonas ginsengisoli]